MGTLKLQGKTLLIPTVELWMKNLKGRQLFMKATTEGEEKLTFGYCLEASTPFKVIFHVFEISL